MEGGGVYGEGLGLRHKWGSGSVQAEFEALGWGQVERRSQGTSLGLLLVEVCSVCRLPLVSPAGKAGVLVTRCGRLTWGMVGETPDGAGQEGRRGAVGEQLCHVAAARRQGWAVRGDRARGLEWAGDLEHGTLTVSRPGWVLGKLRTAWETGLGPGRHSQPSGGAASWRKRQVGVREALGPRLAFY